ncbi:hypothetical protein GGI25_002584 [Coemansia spiralis]|uniref:CRIB domain-containing protein n=2 Tax=Coemansia TaxID=4863 RepID=A0A9W8KYA6_9FUNG|nr:hypothetical protein BX070DRAFT_235223 [Coemansia spiralis]KAJ1992259.1 hypothetical protein EDC05_002927 [Coemansia umbellata]KAJ2623373.1 hypothetical protein GGI26_002411 [Coemansia sp. RSA 1358]KAJ2678080.1 hypothetical protein GGI25_002584 [Coemansia spiralis]
MSSSSYGATLKPYEHSGTDAARESMDVRCVQIQAMSHSTSLQPERAAISKLSSSSSASSRTAAVTADAISNGHGKSSEFPYGLPSAGNGQPMELRHAASMPMRGGETYNNDMRKTMGLRAALANKFTGKKIKDFRLSVSVSSKRQQHQLESLLSLSKAAEEGGNMSSGPTVRGMPVGHPMSFKHVEHLSPTQVGPKMALFNSQPLPKTSMAKPRGSTSSLNLGSNSGNSISSGGGSSIQPASQPEKRSHFRSLKPASLLTKSSKLSLPGTSNSDSNKQAERRVPTIRGRPIGAPSNFQHVEHLSPAEHGMQQFHLLNHRQQQQDILSVLAQSPTGVTKTRPNMRIPESQTEKITYRGLPLSRPLTFEHVEHVSPREYKTRLETKVLEETVAAATAAVDTLLPAQNATHTAESSDDSGRQHARSMDEAASSVHEDAGKPTPRLMALQHTSQNPETAMKASISSTLNASRTRRPDHEKGLEKRADQGDGRQHMLAIKTQGNSGKGKFGNCIN